MLCEYGCNLNANYQLKNGKWCCSKRPSGCAVLKSVNSNINKDKYASGERLNPKKIFDNLSDEAKNRMAWSRGKLLVDNDFVFCENSQWSNPAIRKRIEQLSLLEHKCSICGITSWNSSPITLELDHINGVNNDNRLENLRFLCPNCHSQTDTYKGKNINSGKMKITDDELLTAYKRCGNIRKALLEVGLAAKGGNYNRLKKLIAGVVE